MRKGNGDLVNCICSCGYETGFVIPTKLIKKIIKDGGKVESDINSKTLNMRSSNCPKCKTKNSFDIEFKNIIVEDKNITFSSINRI